MFCEQCGSKLADDARFCTECGAKVGKSGAPGVEDLGTAHVQAAVSNAALTPAPADSKPAGRVAFGRAVEATKQQSRRKVPLIVLVALVAALLTGTAWAAVTVYNEFIAPTFDLPRIEWIHDSSTQEPAQPDSEQPSEPEEPADDQQAGIPVAQGNPQSILEVAEIVAMEPERIPEFLRSQGLADSGDAIPGYEHTWTATGESPYTAVDPDGQLLDNRTPAYNQAYAQILVGTDISPHPAWHPDATAHRRWHASEHCGQHQVVRRTVQIQRRCHDRSDGGRSRQGIAYRYRSVRAAVQAGTGAGRLHLHEHPQRP